MELETCLSSLLAARSLIQEVVIVLDGVAADDWRPGESILSQLDVRIVSSPGSGAAAARNHGALSARGSHLAFIDDDVRIGPGWAKSVELAIADGRDCVTGPVSPVDGSVLARARDLRYRRRYKNVGCGDRVDFLAGGNGLVARAAFDSEGGFPDIPVGSDRLFALNRGCERGACQFCWGMEILHRNDRGVATAVKTAWRAGIADSERSLEDPPVPSIASMRDPAPVVVNMALWTVKAAGWILSRGRGT